MFPDAAGMRRRAAAQANRLAELPVPRIAVATLLVCVHLLMLTLAGHARIHEPFNNSPDEAPYYSQPYASVLGGYPRQPHHWSRLVASRWDAEVYISFAIRGLSACPSKKSPGYMYMHCGLAWFPAYGMLGGNVASIFHLAPDIALMIISILSAILVNYFWTSKLIADRIGKPAAWLTLLAFNAYPSAFYLVAPYTEALTLALVFGGFWLMSKDRWFSAALLIGAASGLRGTALAFSGAFGLAALVATWHRRKASDAAWWKPLASTPLAVWGLVATFVMFQLWVGDALAYVHARKAFGDFHDFGRFLSPVFYLRGFTAQHMDSVMMFGMLGLILLAGRPLLRAFTREQATFLVAAGALGMALVIPTVHEYWGINRYLLTCPLGFLAAGHIARRYPWVFALWMIVCVWMYWHIELCSYVAHGDPHLCPCLGRVEWSAPYDS